ncbi:hypothetical protein COCSUDRAFT_42961 [Coccomyxa subellipsoidea C-169]|uniref:Smr domain-containing protein n=1 Tax=Coccomyxa subellipsoidea (strain C-169) TaxID=574566 RepID=I0YU77_COCSC|nr:hypothetical protein COCSUDRAFT_42961 [Coccomyxa subellipsoidea C-169]EIE21946.1 hypothetical protein COCSUDRAFT_42961 [Coccomyxa subellipsoidea C-169]|eukprot:XP_005646490.1 hypothetical protein COCSUDRAFT_42961 [Coccomyxa subellipsoidea C-169]
MPALKFSSLVQARMNVMQEINILKLHAAFPKLDVDTVNDVLKECGGDTALAQAHIHFSKTSSSQVAQCSPTRLPTRIVTPDQKFKRSPTKPPTPTSASLTPSILQTLMPPAPTQPAAPLPTPKRALRKPLPQPLPLDPDEPEPQMAAPAKKPAALPLHLQHLLSPPPPTATRTPPPTKFEPGGWEETGAQETLKHGPQPIQQDLSAGPSAAPSGGASDEESKLEFLQGMFAGMDAALVADVLQGVDDNAEAAIEKLMALQDVVDHTKTLDSSSGSDDGSISQSQLATKLDSASANGGEPWDVSGVPVDYSFKDLSDEQKVALIRRELPGCSPEEAMNALEVCTGDVDAAIAVMSQAYDRKKPGTPHSGASADVLVLKELYPEVDDSTLNNVYNAAGQNVDVTKKMLQESGLVPFEAPKKPTSVLFSQPTAAEVSAPTQQPMLRANDRPHAMVRRSDAQNQRIYEEHRAHADALREEMRFKYAEAQRANDRGDHRLATELRERAHQARMRYLQADKVASKKILKETNKRIKNLHTVDLHGQHVDQAIRTVDVYLRALQGLPTASKLELITGRGLHSQNNIARLLPAVEDYLKRKNMYYCVHEGGGSILVDILPRDDEPPGEDTYDRDNVYEHG